MDADGCEGVLELSSEADDGDDAHDVEVLAPPAEFRAARSVRSHTDT